MCRNYLELVENAFLMRKSIFASWLFWHFPLLEFLRFHGLFRPFCVPSNLGSRITNRAFFPYLKMCDAKSWKKRTNKIFLGFILCQTCWRFKDRIFRIFKAFDHFFHVFALNWVRIEWKFHSNTIYQNIWHFCMILCALEKWMLIWIDDDRINIHFQKILHATSSSNNSSAITNKTVIVQLSPVTYSYSKQNNSKIVCTAFWRLFCWTFSTKVCVTNEMRRFEYTKQIQHFPFYRCQNMREY